MWRDSTVGLDDRRTPSDPAFVESWWPIKKSHYATRLAAAVSIRRPPPASVITLPRHKRTIRTRQKMRHRRNLLRRARPAHRDALGHIVHLGLRQLLQYLRTDHRRRHRIHANPFRSYLFADRLSKSDHSRLSRRVAAHIGIAFLAGNRGDIDYPSIAARPHVREHRAAAMKHAAHIHRDNMLPVIVGELPNRSGSPRGGECTLILTRRRSSFRSYFNRAGGPFPNLLGSAYSEHLT